MNPVISTGGGPRILPDVGSLFYNGVNWDCLYSSNISGEPIKDRANRTTKFMAWTLNVDGVVTLPKGATTIDSQWINIRKLLSQPGGALAYTGKGFGPLQVNYNGQSIWDAAWGPTPKVIEFKPLGASRSALIKWSCTVNVPEFYSNTFKDALLSFNSETSISFNDKGYATFSYRGSFEIPMTRNNINDRTMPDDLETYRQTFANIDMPNQYRPVRREFSYSEDKRTCTFEYVFEEMPTGGNMPGGIPKGATDARGSYSVSTMPGRGFVRWRATLQASYVIRKDFPRRTAWMLFLGLLRDRMARSLQQFAIGVNGNANSFTPGKTSNPGVNTPNWRNIVTAIPESFNFTEGIYLDGETSSFQCVWTFCSTFPNVLEASGVWKQIPDTSFVKWRASTKSIMGPNNWNGTAMLPENDIIVDLGVPDSP